MMGNWICGGMAGLGILGWILVAIFWIFVIWAILAVVGALTGKKGGWNRSQDENARKEREAGKKTAREDEDEAARILRQRYAKGEINREEFDLKMNDLMRRKM